MEHIDADKVVSLFSTIGRQIKQRCDADTPLLSVTVAQLEALRYIMDQKQISMKDLAEFLSIAPPSATVLVNHLVRLNLVSRQHDRVNRRTIRLGLTKKGKVILTKAIKTRCQRLKFLLNNLNSKEQANLFQLLAKMIEPN